MVDARLGVASGHAARPAVLGESPMYVASHRGMEGGKPPLVRGATSSLIQAGLYAPQTGNARRPPVGSGASMEGVRKQPAIVRGATEFFKEANAAESLSLRGASNTPLLGGSDVASAASNAVGFGAPDAGRSSAYVRGTTKFFHSEARNVPTKAALGTVDAEMDECLEGLLQLRETRDLVVLTMNLQYFASWPRNADAAWRELCTVTSVPPPDVICVQEGLHDGPNVLSEVGYRRVTSSHSCAQPLREMLYSDAEQLKGVDEATRDRLLVNELYVRVDAEHKGSSPNEWDPIDWGVERTSASIPLNHRHAQEGTDDESSQWDLAQRSVVWVKLRHRTRPHGPFVYVLNTHLTSGAKEDQHYLKPAMNSERRRQVVQCLEVFERKAQSSKGDLGVLVGDFGAAPEDAPEGPRKAYFTSSIATSAIMREEALQMGLTREELERRFKAYHCSPFAALAEHDWHLAYNQAQVGPTSDLGDLVDHMATSRSVPVSVKVFPTTNQRTGNHPAITQVPLSDHNFVKATFSVKFPAQETTEKGPKLALPTQHFFIGDGTPAPSPPPEPQVEPDAMVTDRGHIDAADELARRASAIAGEDDAADGEDYSAKYAKLEQEREELQLKYRIQQESIEDLQISLSSEMRELRDKCYEGGQTLSSMAKAMEDARDAVTQEMERYRGTNAMLQAELESEEHQRHALQLEHQAEEEKARQQIEAAEKQLECMEVARRSLGMHLSSIGKIKAGFSEDIREERRWRRELVEQGERQLREWREKHEKDFDELQHELDEHKASHAAWKANAAQIENRLRSEWDEWLSEEGEANAALLRAQQSHEAAKAEIEAKHEACQRHHEELRQELLAVDQENQQFELHHKPGFDKEHQHHEDRSAQVQEEYRVLQAEMDHTRQDIVRAAAHSRQLRDELDKWSAEPLQEKGQGKKGPKNGKRDLTAEARELRKELQDTEEHIQYARKKNEELERDLERADHAGFAGLFGCFRTKAPATKRTDRDNVPPLPPPSSSPPTTAEPTAASDVNSSWV